MEHSRKKAKDSSTLTERIERDEKRQADDLAELERGAEDIERSVREAAAAQKKKSAQSGKALSQGDLTQYRAL
jgi:structural maintenance of chromosome 1